VNPTREPGRPGAAPPIRQRVILLDVGEGAVRERARRYLAGLGLEGSHLDRILASLPGPVTRDLPVGKAAAIAEYLIALGCAARLEEATPPPPEPVPIHSAPRGFRPGPVFALSVVLLLLLTATWRMGTSRDEALPGLLPRPALQEVESGASVPVLPSDGVGPSLGRGLRVQPVAAPAFAVESPVGTDPRAHALNQEGVHLFGQGSFDAALDRFERAHVLAHGNATIAGNLSDLRTYLGWRSVKAQEMDQALVHFERAVETNEENVDAWKGLGFVHLQLKETPEAVRALERAHDLSPGDTDVGIALSRLLYQSDDLQAAEDVLSSLLTRKPGNPEATKLLARMKRDATVEGNFQSNDTGHFRLKFDGAENASVGALVGAVLEEAWAKVGADFHYYPADPVVVILYARDDFRKVSNSPDWSRGIYDGKIRIPVGGVNERSDELEDVIFHEYTHVVVNQITRGRCPTWLNEGLAQVQEPSADGGKQALLAALKSRGPIPLSRLEGSFMRLPESQAQVAYAEGYAAVLYISETWSFFHLRQILDQIGEGKRPEEAVKDVLHFGYEDLEAGIAEYLRRTG
jgi:tetratricopeptide (TPR) repeat protein